MLKLTKKTRRRLLDIGIKNLLYIDAYDYLLCRAKYKSDRTVKFRYVDFYNDLIKDCETFSTSSRNVYRIFQRLEEASLIEIIISGMGEALVKVKFLHELFPQEELELTEESNPQTLEQPHSQKKQKTGIRQQQLIEIKQECRKAGINYRLDKDWWEIASHGLEKVKATIEHMLTQKLNPRNVIRNPRGWFKVALRDNYWLDALEDHEISLSQLEEGYCFYRDKLLDLMGSLPKKITDVGSAPTP